MLDSTCLWRVGALQASCFPLPESLRVHHPARARPRCLGCPGYQLLSTGGLVLQVPTAGRKRAGYSQCPGSPPCLSAAWLWLGASGDASAAWPGYAQHRAEAFPPPRRSLSFLGWRSSYMAARGYRSGLLSLGAGDGGSCWIQQLACSWADPSSSWC